VRLAPGSGGGDDGGQALGNVGSGVALSALWRSAMVTPRSASAWRAEVSWSGATVGSGSGVGVSGGPVGL